MQSRAKQNRFTFPKDYVEWDDTACPRCKYHVGKRITIRSPYTYQCKHCKCTWKVYRYWDKYTNELYAQAKMESLSFLQRIIQYIKQLLS